MSFPIRFKSRGLSFPFRSGIGLKVKNGSSSQRPSEARSLSSKKGSHASQYHFRRFPEATHRRPVVVAFYQSPSLTVLVKSRHYAHFFKQEVNLDEGTGGV